MSGLDARIGGRTGKLPRLLWLWAACAALAAVSLLGGLLVGPAPIANTDLLRQLLDPAAPGHATASAIVWDIRLPRVLGSFVVGACLSLAGVLLQAATRNPIADPYLVGTSAGATLAAVGLSTLAAGLSPWLPWPVADHLSWLHPIAAFAGAMTAVTVAFRLARTGGPASPERVLLAGLVLTAFAGAATSFLLYRATDLQLRAATQWLMGGLVTDSLWQLLPGAAVIGIAGVWSLSRAPQLNALSLGPEAARGLGVDNAHMLRAAVWLSSALAGAAVALAGIIGFVGLLVPHGLRAVAGRDHRWLVPGSVLGGGAFLVWADALSRVVVAPGELPLGILTALAGCPLLLAFVARRRGPAAVADPPVAAGPVADPEGPEPPQQGRSLLRGSAVSVTYPGSATIALAPCEIDLVEGEITALVGPNGCGKSTLLRALAGAVRCRGRFEDGGRTRQAGAAPDARQVAWLPQHVHHEPRDTVRELVELGRTPWLLDTPAGRYFGQSSPNDERAVDAALVQMQLDGQGARPLGELSGGQRQRAYVAMILAQGAPVLLLDEPTTSLDLPQAARTLELLRDQVRARRGAAAVAIHDLQLALRMADRVAVLSEGRLLGTHRSDDPALRADLRRAFGPDIERWLCPGQREPAP